MVTFTAFFPFMCRAMNQIRYRDGEVIAHCLRDLVILSLGQRSHWLYFAFVTRYLLTSQYSSFGVIES